MSVVPPTAPDAPLAATLFELAPDAMVVIGASGRIVYVNQQTEVMFGYPRDELVGQFVEKLIPDRFRKRHVLHRDGYFAYPRLRPMGLGLSLYGQTRDGAEFPVEISLAPIEGNYAVATVRDITAWRRIAGGGATPEVSSVPQAVIYAYMGMSTVTLFVLMVLIVVYRR